MQHILSFDFLWVFYRAGLKKINNVNDMALMDTENAVITTFEILGNPNSVVEDDDDLR